MSAPDLHSPVLVQQQPSEGTARLGYVLKMYPRFSETFVVNEILALEAAGTQIDLFSLRPPVDGRFHADLARVRAAVTYLDPAQLRAGEAWQRIAGLRAVVPGVERCWDLLLDHELRDVVQSLELADHVRRRGLTHLHAHFGSVATTVARLAAAVAGVTFSFTAHAKDIFHTSVVEDDLRGKLSAAAATVTVSEYNLSHLRERFGADAARVHRVYNGLDLNQFPYTEPRDRPRHVLSVGRLVEKKGLADLVDAIALLAAAGDPLTCDIVGAGPLEAELRARVTAAGLDGRIRLMGPRTQDEVRAALVGAAAFAAPCVVGADGNRDGLPTVLLEAMALGTPAVSTPVTGIPEVVQDGTTGLLVPEHSPPALARALARLLDQPDEARRMSAAARSLVEEHFDSRGQALQLLQLFGSGMARGNAGFARVPVPAAAGARA